MQLSQNLVPLPPSAALLAEFRELRATVDDRLAALIAPAHPPNLLDRAMSYALLSPGKRLRPLLTILSAWEFGARDLRTLDAGCALEMVHAASLVLDDLPAMDDAITRRQQPAAHIEFGEDVALLAVISLVSRAFAVLGAAPGLPAHTRAELVAILSHAIGSEGLARGQLLDLRGPPHRGDDEVERNYLKTGVLFMAAVEMAGVISGVDDERLAKLRRCVAHLGEAFQLMDDLTDHAEDDRATVSLRRQASPRDQRRRLEDHLRGALAELEPTGHLSALVWRLFADGFVQRGG